MYINTGQEFDGSDSGARPDEAVSWGKIRADAESVKVSHPILIRICILRVSLTREVASARVPFQVYADATLVFPLVVAATFGKSHWESQGQPTQSKQANGTQAS